MHSVNVRFKRVAAAVSHFTLRYTVGVGIFLRFTFIRRCGQYCKLHCAGFQEARSSLSENVAQ